MGRVELFFKELFHNDTQNERVTALNLQRAYLLAWLILLVQFANLFDPRMYEYTGLFIGEALMVAFSVIYIIVQIYCRHRNYDNLSLRGQKLLYFTYWFFFLIGMIPFYAMDYISIGQPLNCLLSCCLIIAVPIFSGKELLAILLFHTAIIMTVVTITQAGLSNYMYGVVMNFAAFAISANIHSSHIKLEGDADTDFLTKLPNRRLGQDRIKKLWKKCKKEKAFCGMLILDIDFFKDYNDTFGHFVGDIALTQVADCIRLEAKRTTDIVCRLGGEEFLVCMQIDGPRDLLDMARRIKDRVESLGIETAKKDVCEYLTVSIGAADMIPKEEESENTLMFEADSNLYVAKEKGRNRVAYKGEVVDFEK